MKTRQKQLQLYTQIIVQARNPNFTTVLQKFYEANGGKEYTTPLAMVAHLAARDSISIPDCDLSQRQTIFDYRTAYRSLRALTQVETIYGTDVNAPGYPKNYVDRYIEIFERKFKNYRIDHSASDVVAAENHIKREPLFCAQDFIDALRREDYLFFLRFGEFLKNKYTHLGMLDADKTQTLGVHEFYHTDITLAEIKKALYLLELLPDTQMQMEETACLLTNFISAGVQACFFKTNCALNYPGRLEIVDKKTYSELSQICNQEEMVDAFDLFLASKHQPLISEVKEKREDYIKQNIFPFIAKLYGEHSPMYLRIFLKYIPFDQQTVAIDTYFENEQEKNKFKAEVTEYYLSHSFEVFELQLENFSTIINEKVMQRYTNMLQVVPKTLPEYLEQQSDLEQHVKGAAISKTLRDCKPLASENNSCHTRFAKLIADQASYTKLAATDQMKQEMDDYYRNTVRPQMLANIKHQIVKSEQHRYKNDFAKDYIHNLQTLIESKPHWPVSFFCRHSIVVNGERRKAPQHVAEIYRLCLTLDRDNIDAYKLCKAIHKNAVQAKQQFSLFRRQETKQLYQHIAEGYEYRPRRAH